MVMVSAARVLSVALGFLLLLPPGLRAEEDVSERARKQAIRELGRDLRKEARNPRPLDEERRARILKLVEALGALGGPEAAEAGLDGAGIPDTEVRDAVFGLVDHEHGPELVDPLADLLEDKDHRRDADLQRRIARSLSIAADPAAVLPLASLIRTDEDAEVVAEAAEALATYGTAKLALRKEAVEQLVNVYTYTYNMMLSIRAEDRVLAAKMKERWKVYAMPVRGALKALTGQELSRPQDWRTWWNKNKKKRW
jgi:hypothetical protein